MKRIIISISIAALLTACSEIKDKNAQNIPAKTLKGKKAGVAEFELQEVNIPHQYQIAIAWPENIKNIVVEDDGKKVFETSSSKEFLYTVRDQTPFNIRVFSHDSDKPVLLGEYKGETPKDYSFEQLVELKKDLEVEAHRVFFTNQASIQTNGNKLVVKADKIFSENAEIFSFPKGLKAGTNSDGRSGGLVHIQSTVGFGHLKITMRGEHGGDGVNGAPYPTRAADGGVGDSGSHDCLRSPPFGNVVRCWCNGGPGQGRPGSTGSKGNPGSNAGRGGSSGQIIVEIKERSEFVIEPTQEPGLSGKPGEGGDGQEGGIGGPGGNPTSDACGGGAPKGPDGQKGPKGDPGIRPPDGETEKQCLSIGQGEGKCK